MLLEEEQKKADRLDRLRRICERVRKEVYEEVWCRAHHVHCCP
jgi:hypothetical protein